MPTKIYTTNIEEKKIPKILIQILICNSKKLF
uniref:Uncharacterized protein n=1 Tax=viral metagenome TaxID=1070528 RepID=A0A6C0I221_9ZZZZ